MLRLKHILLLLEWYDYRIHRGVAQVARENGWQLNCPKNSTQNESILNNWQGDGCIALLQYTKTLDFFSSHKIPLVDLGLGDHKLPITRVVSDNEAIGRLAAEHFRDHGYKEVFALNTAEIHMYEERLKAFIAHMEVNGGKVTVLDSTGTTESKVIQEMHDLARARGRKLEELSLGFFAYNDTAAAKIISICLKNNLRVPENIAVLGVDNDDLVNKGLSVELSSVDSDLEGLGITAAKTLQKLLDSNSTVNAGSIIRHPPKGVVPRLSTDSYAVANPLVANALHWIKNNFYHGIQATDVAEAMGVTQQGLQKAFAKCYGKSPGQEIRYQRTYAVAHLLQTTDANLDEIAKNCGYYSVNSLINSFRAEHGTTPGSYRKQLKSAAKI